jgi:hypothetical protein
MICVRRAERAGSSEKVGLRWIERQALPGPQACFFAEKKKSGEGQGCFYVAGRFAAMLKRKIIVGEGRRRK